MKLLCLFFDDYHPSLTGWVEKMEAESVSYFLVEEEYESSGLKSTNTI